MKNLFYIFSILFLLSACASKARIKSERDKEKGENIYSTELFNLGGTESFHSVTARREKDEGPISIRFRRVDKDEGAPVFDMEVFANALVPRLKIKKENSLTLKAPEQEFTLSPTTVASNDSEVVAEYFPSFRKESAVFKNLTTEQLALLAKSEQVKLKIEGENRVEEVSLNREAREALQALLQQP